MRNDRMRNKRIDKRIEKRVGKKKVVVFFLLAVSVVVAGLCIFYAVAGRPHIEKVKLTTPVVYDKRLQQCMGKLPAEGLDAVVWIEHEFETVTNAEYNRSTEVRTLGVAGDASILFPGANRLAFSATGYCILGEDTAWRLFGSTKAVGRSVDIRGESYYVAGIEYQEKELCVYGLTPGRDEEVTDLAVRSESRAQMEMDKKRMERWIGA